jgi:hypothetical protein
MHAHFARDTARGAHDHGREGSYDSLRFTFSLEFRYDTL